MRIVVMMGESRYDATRYFCRIVTDALFRAGHEAILWDACTLSPAEFSRLNVDFAPDLTIGFNPVSYHAGGKQPHYEVTGVPHIVFLVDPPAYHVGLRALTNPNHPFVLTVSWFQSFGASAARAGVRAYQTVPFGADPALALRHPPTTHRHVPVLFAGAPPDPDEVRERARRKYPTQPGLAQTVDFLLDAIDSYVHDTGKLLPMHLDELVVELLCPELAPSDQFEVLKSVYPDVDAYYRAQMRRTIVTGLVARGVPLHVVGGSEWRSTLPADVPVHPPRTYREIVEWTAASRVVLSIAPSFFEPHDRFYPAMMCGTVVCSTPVPLFEARHPEARELLISVDLDTLDQTAERLNTLLEDGDARVTLARRTQEFALETMRIDDAAHALVSAATRRWPWLEAAPANRSAEPKELIAVHPLTSP